MLSGALIKTSLIDYPGKVACAWFLTGCSLRCPYCYNADSVFNRLKAEESVTETQVFEHLTKRRNVLSGFVISGGEPLIHAEIPALIQKVKKLGYAVKLDTNGMHPQELERLCAKDDTCPDFIAIDLKTSADRYNLLVPQHSPLYTNKTNPASHRLLQSIDIACRFFSCENREFRTVLVPPLVQKDDITDMAALLPQDARWRFAPFLPENCLDPSYNDIIPYSGEQMNTLVSHARTLIKDSMLR
ncbi:anaerobic ribonucleoside-triphosphate reductase activating protein [Treponema sp. OMZ 840]|uniref:anaerobic ribonucleoside-triphosphate reductase activating protein n=1 Tax=Treponema sp. OMZ 840 TaxID=244313 RepID=UPI003D8BEE77